MVRLASGLSREPLMQLDASTTLLRWGLLPVLRAEPRWVPIR